MSIFVIFIITLPFANAKNYSKSIAEAKISELEKLVLFWKGKEPKITKEVKFYTYDDRNPSYTEYKVWCKDDMKVNTLQKKLGGDYEYNIDEKLMIYNSLRLYGLNEIFRWKMIMIQKRFYF